MADNPRAVATPTVACNVARDEKRFEKKRNADTELIEFLKIFKLFSNSSQRKKEMEIAGANGGAYVEVKQLVPGASGLETVCKLQLIDVDDIKALTFKDLLVSTLKQNDMTLADLRADGVFADWRMNGFEIRIKFRHGMDLVEYNWNKVAHFFEVFEHPKPQVTFVIPKKGLFGKQHLEFVVRELARDCPWSKNTDFRQFCEFLKSECDELLEVDSFKEAGVELGDVLFDSLMLVEIFARDTWHLTPADGTLNARTHKENIYEKAALKFKRRTPYMKKWGTGAIARTPEECMKHWKAAKALEKAPPPEGDS